jgi:hypothetical protein
MVASRLDIDRHEAREVVPSCRPPAWRFELRHRADLSLVPVHREADAKAHERRYLPLVMARIREPVLLWGDRLLSLGLVVGGQLAVWEFGWSLSNLALAAVMVCATVPLFWRRRFPLGALVVVVVAALSTFVLLSTITAAKRGSSSGGRSSSSSTPLPPMRTSRRR